MMVSSVDELLAAVRNSPHSGEKPHSFSLSLLKRIEIDPLSQIVHAQAGALIEDIERALSACGLTLALPDDVQSMQLGEWIARGLPGAQTADDDPVQHALVSLQAVLANGTVIETRAVPRRAIGPDFPNGCFVGGEGRIGIIISAHLAARTIPEKRGQLAFEFPSVASREEAVAWIRGLGIRALRVHTDGVRVSFEFAGISALVDAWLGKTEEVARKNGGKPVPSFGSVRTRDPRRSHALLAAIARELDPQNILGGV